MFLFFSRPVILAMRLVVQLLVLVLVVGFCVTLWLLILTLHLRFVLVVTSPKWYVRRTAEFWCCKVLFYSWTFALEDSYTIQSSLPQQFQVSQSTFRQSRQVLIKYMGNNLICNLVRTTPEILSWNLRVAFVMCFSSRYPTSASVLPSYLFMAGTCARWCHGSCAMLKGKLWRRLRRPGLSDVAKHVFFACRTCSRYWCCWFKMVQDCTCVQDLLKCVDWNWSSMLWGKHDMFYGWGWIDGFLKSLEDMKKCVVHG